MLYGPPKEWIYDKKTKFFEIGDFVSKVKLSKNVLLHAQDTGEGRRPCPKGPHSATGQSHPHSGRSAAKEPCRAISKGGCVS